MSSSRGWHGAAASAAGTHRDGRAYHLHEAHAGDGQQRKQPAAPERQRERDAELAGDELTKPQREPRLVIEGRLAEAVARHQRHPMAEREPDDACAALRQSMHSTNELQVSCKWGDAQDIACAHAPFRLFT